uniref:Lymphocyte cytosolic protein 2 n=1 Tax=Chelydra serpentina TaxID=8475 RepID=A0A8C3SZF5_CHESE
MDLQNIPYRSVVAAWSPDDLAEYFKKVSFANMSENDIQKFPKLSCLFFTCMWQEEEDDYESPDEEQEKDADYESPTDEPGHDSDDYEPPPSNNDVAPHNVIFPAKSIPSNTEYIDRPTSARPSPQPPIPPHAFDLCCTISLLYFRSLGEQLAKIQKPPIPPADKHERGNPAPGRKPPPVKQGWAPERRYDVTIPQRPAPQLSLPPFSSNTFPSRSVKPPPKHSPSGSNSMPGSYAERFVALVIFSPILSYYLLRNESPTFSSFPPTPPPKKKKFQDSLNADWYVADISRQEAEAALRNINKDGTFLVRDSSRKTNTHPYVLMVLYKDKVYNIQIRYQEQNQVYLLGTGLKGKEDFSSVADIIDYFQRTPLLLIDGKDRGSRNQCKLTYAAGFT